MSKPRLAFVDHSYHRKTGTSAFLSRILEEFFTVDRYWDDAWRGGGRLRLSELDERGYAAIVFFQVAHYFPRRDTRRLRCRNLISVPMYDDVRRADDGFWIRQRHYRHLCFCRATHRRLVRLGIPSLYVQYFPDPAAFRANNDFSALRGFFWQRTPEITWETIRPLVADTRFDSFHLHLAPDPPEFAFQLPNTNEASRLGLTTSSWFERKEEFLSLLETSNLFFSPRSAEGIGMSFLEAMAQGKCVVAPDAPTMNEYICDGHTGILYNPQETKGLDFSRAAQLGAEARNSCVAGHRAWLNSIPMLAKFVQEEWAHPVQPLPQSVQRARAMAYVQLVTGRVIRSPARLANLLLRRKSRPTT